jgi:hypothetical protein
VARSRPSADKPAPKSPSCSTRGSHAASDVTGKLTCIRAESDRGKVQPQKSQWGLSRSINRSSSRQPLTTLRCAALALPCRSRPAGPPSSNIPSRQSPRIRGGRGAPHERPFRVYSLAAERIRVEAAREFLERGKRQLSAAAVGAVNPGHGVNGGGCWHGQNPFPEIAGTPPGRRARLPQSLTNAGPPPGRRAF